MAFSDTKIRDYYRFRLPFDHHRHSNSDWMTHSHKLMPDISEVDKSIIEPFPAELSPSGFDLRVGRYIAKSDVLYTHLTYGDFFSMNPTFLHEGKSYTFLHDKDGGVVYYVLSHEKFNLPNGLEMIIDARSTTGRVGGMCHGVGSGVEGEKIIALQPFSFPITVTSGKTSLAQAIIRFKGTEFIDYKTLAGNTEGISLHKNGRDVFDESLKPNGLIISFSSHLVYCAKDCKEPIDMDVEREIDPNLYFEVIEGNSNFKMDARTFYLTGTREVIGLENICGRISRESDISGTGLWSHFAGFVQPGFSGGLTLECYSLNNRMIRDGEPAGFVIFDKVDGKVGKGYNGAYQNQTVPKLPKMFKDF